MPRVRDATRRAERRRDAPPPEVLHDHHDEPPNRRIGATRSGQPVLAFAPVHKRALAMATGSIVGVAVVLATAVGILTADPSTPAAGVPFPVLPGHDLSWAGAVKGGVGAAFAAFAFAWFFAFCGNLVLAIRVWSGRRPSERIHFREFLDHV